MEKYGHLQQFVSYIYRCTPWFNISGNTRSVYIRLIPQPFLPYICTVSLSISYPYVMGGIFPGHKEKCRLCFYTNKDSSLIVFIMPVRVHVQVFLRSGFPLKQHEMPCLRSSETQSLILGEMARHWLWSSIPAIVI